MKRFLPAPILVFQSCLPDVLRQSKTRSVPSSLVRKILSSQMAGVELPMPGRGAIQAMFFLAVHWAGRLVSLLMPSRFVPRHCGKLSARTVMAATRSETHASNVRSPFMGKSSFFCGASIYDSCSQRRRQWRGGRFVLGLDKFAICEDNSSLRILRMGE